MNKMFRLINSDHQNRINEFVQRIKKTEINEIINDLGKIIELIRSDIPEKKRISYGRYSIIKEMGVELYPLLIDADVNVFDFSLGIFRNPDIDQFVRSLAIQLISIYATESNSLERVLPVFEQAAGDDHWEMRECAAGFVHKLTIKYPKEMHEWYLKMVKSENLFQRRFASESLRPVSENRWLYKQPDFAFSIIKHLFKESKAYPRTSVGNNLSDWMRVNKEITYPIVEKLAKSGDKNSYWIAYRACRNLVKKEPDKVMDLLGVREYRYKDRFFEK